MVRNCISLQISFLFWSCFSESRKAYLVNLPCLMQGYTMANWLMKNFPLWLFWIWFIYCCIRDNSIGTAERSEKESSRESNEREKWLCMGFCASLAPGFTHLEQSKWHATCSAGWISNSKHVAECTWHIIFFFLLFFSFAIYSAARFFCLFVFKWVCPCIYFEVENGHAL